jgi:hypothetical protein
MWAVAALRLLRVTAGAQRDQISSNPFLIPRRSGSGVPGDGNGNDETTSQTLLSPSLSLSSSFPPLNVSLGSAQTQHQRQGIRHNQGDTHPLLPQRSHRGLLARALGTA